MRSSPASPKSVPAELLRALPSVERVLSLTRIDELKRAFGHAAVVSGIRDVLASLRGELESGMDASGLEAALSRLPESIEEKIRADLAPSLRPVVNATGVIVHTNLGRAPLSARAIDAVARVARGYSNLELDLDDGKRGSRHQHASHLLSRLFPGKEALVVNNAAAGVMLSLNTFARGKEVVISRGELVEIGGSFRVPDILERSGATLREVGTTNKTRIADYRNAIAPETGALLRVHPSNFRIVGFTESATTVELVALGAETSIPVIEDFGSGNLVSLDPFGLNAEPTVDDSLASGVHLSIFSGDKLLGGPQAGILVGTSEAIEACRRNPMARALRVDKLTYAALEATLVAFIEDKALRDIPVLRMISESVATIQARAENLIASVEPASGLKLSIEEGRSRVGGGAAADATIATCVIAVEKSGMTADALLRALRESDPPVIARIASERVLIDLRSVPVDDEPCVVRALSSLR